MNDKRPMFESKLRQYSQTPVSGSNYFYTEKDVIANTKVPIKRGCPNRECLCTGKCNEIIGWRDKLPNEF